MTQPKRNAQALTRKVTRTMGTPGQRVANIFAITVWRFSGGARQPLSGSATTLHGLAAIPQTAQDTARGGVSGDE